LIHSTKTSYFLFLTRWEGKQGNVGEDILASAEESAMANFDFLSREEDLEDEDEVSWVWGGGEANPAQLVLLGFFGGFFVFFNFVSS